MDYLKPLEMVRESADWAGQLKGPSFEVEPNVLYPQTIAHIRAQLAVDGWVAPEHLRPHFSDAKKIADEVWDLALTERAEIPAKRLAERAEALECARRWFTSALHAAIGNAPMNLRITKDEGWRL